MPAPLPGSQWTFPPAETADRDGLVASGGDLEPATLVDAYRRGLFPMPAGRMLGWWSPEPRGVVPLDGLRVTRSLRRSLRRYEITIDTAFGDVVTACGDPRRPHGWISPPIRDAYGELHRLGYAHSVEAWDGHRLVGGLYGVAVGGLFAGESMFHRAADASKVALVALVATMRALDMVLLDVQWTTPHLRSLGAVDVTRAEYLRRLRSALDVPGSDRWVLPADWR